MKFVPNPNPKLMTPVANFLISEAEILQKRIMEEAEWKILPKAVRLFCDGKITVEGDIVHIKE